MTQKNSSYEQDLNQIRERQVAVLAEIDEIQERYGTLPAELAKIQSDALGIVHKLEGLCQRSETQEEQ